MACASDEKESVSALVFEKETGVTYLGSDVILCAEPLTSAVVLVSTDDSEHPEDVARTVTESVVNLVKKEASSASRKPS